MVNTLDPFRRQVLHDPFLCCILDSASQSRTLSSAVVISPNFVGNRNSVRPIVAISDGRRPRIFRASPYFTIRVFGKMK